MIMFRTALATTFLAVVAVMIGSGSASGAFPGSDGKIAFVNDRNGTPSIFTVSPDGTKLERLVPNEPQGGFTSSSPDGETMLFSVRVSTRPALSYELLDDEGQWNSRQALPFANLQSTIRVGVVPGRS